jgi:Domain of unknown function (DUF4304)
MSSEDFKTRVLAQLHAVLKPEGFRKKQSTFSSETDHSVLFVQLQSSIKTTKDSLVVTVNLGIFSKRVAVIVGNTRKPNILEAHWQDRIGHFMHEGVDKWWEIHNRDEADLVGREISTILSTEVLPKMKSLASTNSLKSLWESGISPGLTDFERKQYLQALQKSE